MYQSRIMAIMTLTYKQLYVLPHNKIKSDNGRFLSATQSNQQGCVQEQKEPLSPVIFSLSLCLGLLFSL